VKLNPYQKRLMNLKGEMVIVEFINSHPPLRGRITEVDVWNNKFFINVAGREFLVMGGVQTLQRIEEDDAW